MRINDQLNEKVKDLPESIAEDVLNYIAFLEDKEARAELENLMNAQALSMDAIWDNSEDDVWNDL